MSRDLNHAKGREVSDGYRDPGWPEGFYWSEAEGRPVYLAQRDDSSVSVGQRGASSPFHPPLRSVGVPHLERACDLLWQAGHPAIAEALCREVEALLLAGADRAR